MHDAVVSQDGLKYAALTNRVNNFSVIKCVMTVVVNNCIK